MKTEAACLVCSVFAVYNPLQIISYPSQTLRDTGPALGLNPAAVIGPLCCIENLHETFFYEIKSLASHSWSGNPKSKKGGNLK